MRAISDYLAKEFAARGLRLAAHQLIDGRQRLTFENEGRFADIEAGPFASDAEIWAAIRKAFNMTDDNIETVESNPPTSDKMPIVELAPAVDKHAEPEPKMGGVMSKGYRPGALKALLDGLHKEGRGLMDDVAEQAAKVQKAYGHLRSARDDLKAHSESIMAELGQFSNFGEED